jgi:putative ABC transport system substrate-binding protein
MNRRAFVALLGGVAAPALFSPLAARAEQPAIPVIGFLHTRSGQDFAPKVAALVKALAEAGYVEGRNVRIEYRFAHGQYDRLPTLAAELIEQHVAVLVAGGGEASALVAKAATATIPIVFVVGSDPVAAGIVASYNRPGANVTGVNILTDTLEAKRLGLLRELVPLADTVGFLWNPRFASAERQVRDAQEAARGLATKVHVLPASSEAEIDAAFGVVKQERILALSVGADPLLDTYRDKIIALAARDALPVMYQFTEHAAAGGLMSYRVDALDAWRQVGVYVGRILKGDKPADLPVLQPTKFEFVINLKTAKASGIEIPAKLLALADEVIE